MLDGWVWGETKGSDMSLGPVRTCVKMLAIGVEKEAEFSALLQEESTVPHTTGNRG